MLGDLSRQVTAESSLKLRELYRARIFLTDTSIATTGPLVTNEEVRCSTMYYSLAYRPTWKKIHQKKPFLLKCDLYKTQFKRFNDYEDLEKDAETDLASAFLLKWSDIKKESFERAEQYCGMQFTIGMKWSEYFEHIENIYREVNKTDDKWANHILSSTEFEEASRIRIAEVNEYREKSAHNSNEIRRQRNAAKRLAKEQSAGLDRSSEV